MPNDIDIRPGSNLNTFPGNDNGTPPPHNLKDDNTIDVVRAPYTGPRGYSNLDISNVDAEYGPIYDPDHFRSYYPTWQYENQTVGRRWANAAARLGGLTILEIGNGMAIVGDIANNIANGADKKDYFLNTPSSDIMDAAKESVREAFPIYKSPDYIDYTLGRRLGTASFWTDEAIEGLSFMLSFYAPGFALKGFNIGKSVIKSLQGVSKGLKAEKGLLRALGKIPELGGKAVVKDLRLGALGKFANITDKSVAKLGSKLDTFMISSYMTGIESFIEGKGARDAAYAEMKNTVNPNTGEIYTQSEMDDLAYQIASNTFKGNVLALAASNLYEANLLFGGFRLMSKIPKTLPGMMKYTTKNVWKNAGWAMLKSAAVEGAYEENIQGSMSRYFTDKALKRPTTSILGGMIDNFFTTEGQTEIFLGAIMGLVPGGIGAYRGAKESNEAHNKIQKLVALSSSTYYPDNLGMLKQIKNSKGNITYTLDPEGIKNLLSNSTDVNALHKMYKLLNQINSLAEVVNSGNPTALKAVNDIIFAEFASTFLNESIGEGGEIILNEKLEFAAKKELELLTKLGEIDNFTQEDVDGIVSKYKALIPALKQFAIKAQATYDSILGESATPVDQQVKDNLIHALYSTLARLHIVRGVNSDIKAKHLSSEIKVPDSVTKELAQLKEVEDSLVEDVDVLLNEKSIKESSKLQSEEINKYINERAKLEKQKAYNNELNEAIKKKDIKVLNKILKKYPEFKDKTQREINKLNDGKAKDIKPGSDKPNTRTTEESESTIPITELTEEPSGKDEHDPLSEAETTTGDGRGDSVEAAKKKNSNLGRLLTKARSSFNNIIASVENKIPKTLGTLQLSPSDKRLSVDDDNYKPNISVISHFKNLFKLTSKGEIEIKDKKEFEKVINSIISQIENTAKNAKLDGETKEAIDKSLNETYKLFRGILASAIAEVIEDSKMALTEFVEEEEADRDHPTDSEKSNLKDPNILNETPLSKNPYSVALYIHRLTPPGMKLSEVENLSDEEFINKLKLLTGRDSIQVGDPVFGEIRLDYLSEQLGVDIELLQNPAKLLKKLRDDPKFRKQLRKRLAIQLIAEKATPEDIAETTTSDRNPIRTETDMYFNEDRYLVDEGKLIDNLLDSIKKSEQSEINTLVELLRKVYDNMTNGKMTAEGWKEFSKEFNSLVPGADISDIVIDGDVDHNSPDRLVEHLLRIIQFGKKESELLEPLLKNDLLVSITHWKNIIEKDARNTKPVIDFVMKMIDKGVPINEIQVPLNITSKGPGFLMRGGELRGVSEVFDMTKGRFVMVNPLNHTELIDPATREVVIRRTDARKDYTPNILYWATTETANKEVYPIPVSLRKVNKVEANSIYDMINTIANMVTDNPSLVRNDSDILELENKIGQIIYVNKSNTNERIHFQIGVNTGQFWLTFYNGSEIYKLNIDRSGRTLIVTDNVGNRQKVSNIKEAIISGLQKKFININFRNVDMEVKTPTQIKDEIDGLVKSNSITTDVKFYADTKGNKISLFSPFDYNSSSKIKIEAEYNRTKGLKILARTKDRSKELLKTVEEEPTDKTTPPPTKEEVEKQFVDNPELINKLREALGLEKVTLTERPKDWKYGELSGVEYPNWETEISEEFTPLLSGIRKILGKVSIYKTSKLSSNQYDYRDGKLYVNSRLGNEKLEIVILRGLLEVMAITNEEVYSKVKPIYNEYISFSKGFTSPIKITSERSFLRHALSNKAFRDHLREIDTKDNKTIWDKIIDFFLKLFGLSKEHDTILDRLSNVYDEAIESKELEIKETQRAYDNTINENNRIKDDYYRYNLTTDNPTIEGFGKWSDSKANLLSEGGQSALLQSDTGSRNTSSIIGKNYTYDELNKLLIDDIFDHPIYEMIKKHLQDSNVLYKFDNLPSGTSEGRNYTVAGQYDVETHTITINPLMVSTANLKRTILHESIHAVTLSVMYSKTNKFATEDQRKAVNELHKLLKIINDNPDFHNEYGITNIRELLAELSNPTFVAKLKNVQFNKKESLFERIILTILKILGLNTYVSNATSIDVKEWGKNTSAYDIVNQAFTDIVSDFDKNIFKTITNDAIEVDDNISNLRYETDIKEPLQLQVEEVFNNNPESANKIYEIIGAKDISDEMRKSLPYRNTPIGTSLKIYISANKGLEVENKTGERYLVDEILDDETNIYKRTPEYIREQLSKIRNLYWGNQLNYYIDQQKQQAIQLYSQHLKTIFPDSIIKNINYHGTEYKQKFEQFNSKLSGTQTKENLKTKGFWFTYNRELANDFGLNVISVLLNIRNPYYATVKYEGQNAVRVIFPDQVESVNKAIKEGYDSAFVDVLENFETGKGNTELVVFEPEQIHILFSEQDIESFKTFINGINEPTIQIESDIKANKAIEDLFNSNPELANKVYEAMGFQGKVPEQEKIQTGSTEYEDYGYVKVDNKWYFYYGDNIDKSKPHTIKDINKELESIEKKLNVDNEERVKEINKELEKERIEFIAENVTGLFNIPKTPDNIPIAFKVEKDLDNNKDTTIIYDAVENKYHFISYNYKYVIKAGGSLVSQTTKKEITPKEAKEIFNSNSEYLAKEAKKAEKIIKKLEEKLNLISFSTEDKELLKLQNNKKIDYSNKHYNEPLTKLIEDRSKGKTRAIDSIISVADIITYVFPSSKNIYGKYTDEQIEKNPNLLKIIDREAYDAANDILDYLKEELIIHPIYNYPLGKNLLLSKEDEANLNYNSLIQSLTSFNSKEDVVLNKLSNLQKQEVPTKIKLDRLNETSLREEIITSLRNTGKTEQELIDYLKEKYPEIKLDISNNPIWEQGDNVFNQKEYNNQVQYRIKAVEILISDKAKQVFEKGKRSGWDLNKILTELQVPKEQKQIILDKGIKDREEIITSLLAENSFVVEINTATDQKFVDQQSDFTETLLDDDYNSDTPSKYYSHMTVPGGTKYTENEIAIPGQLVEKYDEPISIKLVSSGITTDGNYDARSYSIIKKGKQIGYISLPIELENKSDLKSIKTINSIELVGLDKEERGKKYALSAYKQLITELSKENIKLSTNVEFITKGSRGVWDDLVKEGFAIEKNGDYISTDKTLKKIKERINSIIPNIKGHAEFSTDNGIGWFRSDEQVLGGEFIQEDFNRESVQYIVEDLIKKETIDGISTKTRRLLELQSDLFQKGRHKEDLITNNSLQSEIRDIERYISATEYVVNDYEKVLSGQMDWYYDKYELLDDRVERFDKEGKVNLYDTKEEAIAKLVSLGSTPEKAEYNIVKTDSKETDLLNKKDAVDKRNIQIEKLNNLKEQVVKFSNINNESNKFLQLLNKDNNWVTFFIKSIMQDSAKKGYEKVLFPTGETAAKIEGHQTIAEEIKRIDSIYNIINNADEIREDENNIYVNSKGIFVKLSKSNYTYSETSEFNFNTKSKVNNKQLYLDKVQSKKQELKSQGIEKLAPIEAFYEIRIGRILEKLYGKGNVKTITDEFGNQWREVTINQARDLANILLQKNEANQIIGQANIKAMSILVDAINKKADTIPHEYAHHYIAWFRNTPIVQEGIKRFGSEEGLVQAIGEQVVKQKGEAYNWWKKFTNWILSLLSDKQLLQILTDSFLNRQDLNDFSYNEVASQQKQDAIQLYSQYLKTIFPVSKQNIEGFKNFISNNSNTTKQSNLTNEDIQSLIASGDITWTDEKGDPCAKMGLTNTVKGTNWRIVKDFKGKPKHSHGGVDITIGNDGVTMRRGGKDIKAKHGLLIQNK